MTDPLLLEVGDVMMTRDSGAWPQGSIAVVTSADGVWITMMILYNGLLLEHNLRCSRGTTVHDWEHGWHVFKRSR